ncbi:two-partner secretion domain-containing protein [Yersinia enterocolitica]|uniref:filamentous hemagglutinin N-terminal domain-containing protein n=1 Tax=Yersinia enterocolitica TaxID=630 RepID=UPI001C8DA2FF|nr:filamentous hemagglutinin N-terminal domain-containing protein [Yersinia enterocolitica]MBX9496222.1 filamentous hemagglutinin N-terminal domain-containing protein [Yersinia enterocolitica]
MISSCPYTEMKLTNNKLRYYCGFLSWAFYIITPSYAEIVADENAPKHQQPDVFSVYMKESQSHCKALNAYCRGANYTTVNIQTPNEQGISQNKYKKFNVLSGAGYDKVSLNNFIASSVTGNPNLVAKPAKVILNEVTSSHISILNGPLIVAGDNAHVVIVNPAGIYCNGCHFINTDHVTLTTGLAILSDGYVRGYNVIEGIVEIGGNGLTLNDEIDSYLDIFSHSLTVEGEIRAKDILAILGKNAVSYAPINGNVNVKSLVGFTSKDKDNIGLDVRYLGGMYANKIFIFSRDGQVKNAGVLNANKKTNIISKRSIKNSGKISAENINLHSFALIDNQSGAIKNIRYPVDFNKNDKVGLNIESRLFNNNKGYIYSNVGDVNIKVEGRFYNAYGMIRTIGTYGSTNIKIKAEVFHNFSGVIATSNNINIDADIVKNNEGRIVSAFGTLDLRYKTLEGKAGLLHGGIEVKQTLK